MVFIYAVMPVPVFVWLFFFKIDNITLDMDPDPNWAKILDPNLDIKKTYHPKRAACRDWWLEGRSSRLPRRDLCKNVFSPIIILVKIALINKFDQTFSVIYYAGRSKEDQIISTLSFQQGTGPSKKIMEPPRIRNKDSRHTHKNCDRWKAG